MVPIAIAAGLFVPGLGQIVQGHTRRGGIVFVVVVVALVLASVTVFALPALVVLHLAGIVDGARLASRPVRWPWAVAVLVLWIATIGGVRFALLELFRVSATASMVPTLTAGDIVAVRKHAAVARGDVVVFELPCDPTREYVKRVVALAGQTVEVRCRVLFVDGKPQAGDGGPDFPDVLASDPPGCSDSGTIPRGRLEPSAPAPPPVDPCLPQRRYVVPAGTLFVVGDNRAGSHDSRAFGGVPASAIRGRVTGVIWPLASFGKVR